MDERVKIGLKLVDKIYRAVKPAIGIRVGAKKIGVSNDWQYLVDVKAEGKIKIFFKKLWNSKAPYGYFTEDQGLVLPPHEVEGIYLIDPVDGSRPAQRGMNTCNIVVAYVPFSKKPKLSDIEIGIVRPLFENSSYVSTSQKVFISRKGELKEVSLIPSPIRDIGQCFVDIEMYTIPMNIMGLVYAPLDSSVNAIFYYHSISYGFFSVATSRVEGCVDARFRVYKDFPKLHREFGTFLKISNTLDVCGVYQLVKNSGSVITDAYGREMDDTPIFKNDKPREISCVVANCREVHSELLKLLEKGINNLKKYESELYKDAGAGI